ncbi:hypothetical protein CWE12_08775 [Aliidiomarina sedimenti]|uniref:CYTH domain-containing protein n=1 Tax=Aliidiomarina sedimenti TaxID=1933879 RepID=A0ABY0BZE5_9GAMM|nr:CYTH domain-containing protein [Aliidiomarina sedimenti]RUO30042.1 hypothetical protein CWE12_08775 [Aliidiomarina sedimenti]
MTQDSSATESELKFTLSDDSAVALMQYLTQHMQPQTTLQLSNEYFDTSDGQLNHHRIGCRIRRWFTEGEQHAEQTVKLAGQIADGLHQRPEYNLPQGKQLKPNLTSFPSTMWPDKLNVSAVNDALEMQFKVEFERRRWHGGWPLDAPVCELEIVLDQGVIQAGEKQEPVFEVEMELLSGDLQGLVDCGETLASRFNLQHFNKSKAERGFRLARGE